MGILYVTSPLCTIHVATKHHCTCMDSNLRVLLLFLGQYWVLVFSFLADIIMKFSRLIQIFLHFKCNVEAIWMTLCHFRNEIIFKFLFLEGVVLCKSQTIQSLQLSSILYTKMCGCSHSLVQALCNACICTFCSWLQMITSLLSFFLEAG